jgi:hypothetical protein
MNAIWRVWNLTAQSFSNGEIISLTEKKLLADGGLMSSISESRVHPETLVTRDRSKSSRT